MQTTTDASIKNITDATQYPLYKYQDNIVLIDDEKKLLPALEEMQSERIIGFDSETKPSFKKGEIHLPALLQIACSNKVFLIRLNKIGLHDGVKKLLSNAANLKVGFNILQDIKELKQLSYFNSNGFIDLDELKNITGNGGMRKNAIRFLGVRISKTQQKTNWELEKLTKQQLVYAATDAWISREIYLYATRNKVCEFVPKNELHYQYFHLKSLLKKKTDYRLPLDYNEQNKIIEAANEIFSGCQISLKRKDVVNNISDKLNENGKISIKKINCVLDIICDSPAIKVQTKSNDQFMEIHYNGFQQLIEHHNTQIVKAAIDNGFQMTLKNWREITSSITNQNDSYIDCQLQ